MANGPYMLGAEVLDTNGQTLALTGNRHILVRHISDAEITFEWGSDGAQVDLDSCVFTNGDRTVPGISGGGSTVYATFENVESDTFCAVAMDADGNVGRVELTPNDYGAFVDYIKLTCNAVDSRPDASGTITLSCYGNYFNGSFGAQSNTLTVYCAYKRSGSSSWTQYSMDVTTYSDSYSATKTITGLDYQGTYDFRFDVIDKLMSEGADITNVRSVPMFHWGENDVVFEVPVTFNAGTEIEDDLRIKGDLRLKGDGNYGNYLRFGDGSYCYIAELDDDIMTIKAGSLAVEVTNSFTVNGNEIGGSGGESGIWIPMLNDSVVAVYNQQTGWYNKVGNVVTVGFYVKALCYGGYEDEDVVITGLLQQHTPAVSAAGGGLCSGTYMTANHNFQCFVAERDGSITVRTQACDGTSGTELATSASGCKYPSESGYLTLSGTITYMIN